MPHDPTKTGPSTASTGRDLRHVALSVIPGAGLVAIGRIFDPALLHDGWPLFAIVGLGLFAGTLATLSATSPAVRK